MTIIRLSLFILISFLSWNINGQVLKPVSWSFNIEPISGNEYNLIYTAKMKKGWNVYSQFTSDDGPVPTEITYESIDGAQLVGKGQEKGYKKEGFDKLFDTNVIKFIDKEPFIITQKIKVTDPTKPISGYLTFMTCDNERCLPPDDIEFTFTIPEIRVKSNDAGIAPQETPSAVVKESLTNTAAQQPKFKKIDIKTPKITSATPVAKDAINDNIENKGIFKPVTWTVDKVDNGNGDQDIVFKAVMQKGWNVYSQFTSDEGPVPTSITFENQEGVELLGPASEEGYKKEGPDPLFDNVTVIKYLDKEPFILTQKIKVLDESKPLSGYMTYMTCNDKTCLPPTDVEFSYFGDGSSNAYAGDIVNTLVDGKIDQTRATLKATASNPLSDCGKGESSGDSTSLLWLFLAGILGGFAALMTPCVFPMIPITVSFFTKDTKRKGWMNGLIYGLSIIIIYVALGLLITIFAGPEALNALSTNWIANVLFFTIFIVFAFSFFGYYELTLPSSWTTKTDTMADKGGLLGIFFMAATLSLVSFSCTGPIVGSALVAAANGGYIGPAIVMLGFSMALALPFGLFAAFPAWLNSLPRSGGWMNSVKVVLGFLEVGFAFKFLSTADLTQHWGILPYEVFMVIMVLVSLAIAIYLFGFIKFPHDSKVVKLSATRKVLGTAFAALAIYLCAGFTINKDTGIYNSLWLTSGFSPPVNYNILLEKGKANEDIKARYPSFTKCANNIDCFKNYFEGMNYAKEVNKPVFVDFTGHGCQNCRRVEDQYWVKDRVREILNDEVVLVSLYVDDREKLEEPFISNFDNKKKRNVGNQWADFQVVNFDRNSQPWYTLITTDEQVITQPQGYDYFNALNGAQTYEEYLECGIKEYKAMQ